MTSPSYATHDAKIFQSTFIQSPVGLAHVALDGHWILANERLCAILGYSQKALEALTLQDLTDPGDQETFFDNVQRLLVGEITRGHVELRQRRGDGTQVWTDHSFSLVRGRSGEPQFLLSAIEDITNQKHTETEMRCTQECLERQASLIELVRDAIVLWEIDIFRITFWNRGAERTYGWTQAEAIGKNAFDLLQTQFPASQDDIIAQVAGTGHWEGDLSQLRKDGARIIVSSRWATRVDEETCEVLEISRDVTRQRRREALREAYSTQQERIAEALQRSLLMAPPSDLFPGITIKAFYSGAEEDILVGGDFFDIYAAEIKFALRALLREYPSPAVALTRLNAFVCDKERLDLTNLGSTYVALSLVVVDTATGEIQAAIAGMEMPLLVRATDETMTLGAGGLLLGVTKDAKYENWHDLLGVGDLLVMSTDGITEARHPSRRLDFFGIERLQQAVREEAARTKSLSETAQVVAARARAFAGGSINDDVCLLLARRQA